MQDIETRIKDSMRHSLYWHLFRDRFLELAREKPIYAILIHSMYSEFELFQLPDGLDRWTL
jgi:hypothetical protein